MSSKIKKGMNVFYGRYSTTHKVIAVHNDMVWIREVEESYLSDKIVKIDELSINKKGLQEKRIADQKKEVKRLQLSLANAEKWLISMESARGLK
jgi:hypothetical protein